MSEHTVEIDARCWCGMTAEEHVPHQSRCPKTPEEVRTWQRTLDRVIPPGGTKADGAPGDADAH